MTTLRKLRLERHLSQGALGEMLGDLDYNTVGRWEARQCAPSWENAQALERIFGLSAKALMSPIPESERAGVPRRSDVAW